MDIASGIPQPFSCPAEILENESQCAYMALIEFRPVGLAPRFSLQVH
jgi:hypothetical protein